MGTIKLEIVTPEGGRVYGREVEMVIVRSTAGELGILPKHARLLTELLPHALRIKVDGAETLVAVGGGFMEVTPDKITVKFLGLTFNWDTLCMTWLAMAVVIFVSCLAVRAIKLVPHGWQNFIELVFLWLNDQLEAMMGKKRAPLFAPFILALFLFLLTSNLLGLIPFLESPTNDLNTTLGLALLVIFLVHFFGLYFKGTHYIAHFFQPVPPFVIINLIEEIAKPITLAFRLFGNILAGEILIIVLLHLIPIWMPVPSVVWLLFSIFISCVHAVIFTMLSMAYLSNAVKDE